MTDNDKELREEFFGKNDPVYPEPKTLCDMITDCFGDLMLQILVIASIVSTTLGII